MKIFNYKLLKWGFILGFALPMSYIVLSISLWTLLFLDYVIHNLFNFSLIRQITETLRQYINIVIIGENHYKCAEGDWLCTVFHALIFLVCYFIALIFMYIIWSMLAKLSIKILRNRFFSEGGVLNGRGH